MFVDELYPVDELDSEHEDGLEAEHVTTGDEQLLQIGTEQLHDQGVVLAAGTVVVEPIRNAALQPYCHAVLICDH